MLARQALRRLEAATSRHLAAAAACANGSSGLLANAVAQEGQPPAAAVQLTCLKRLWDGQQSLGYASKAGKKKQGRQAEVSEVVEELSFDLKDVERSMQQPVEKLKASLSGIRTGRASPGMLDRIKVAAYGESTPSHTLKSLAGVAVRSPQLLAVSVFDPSTLPAVEKAIREGPLGLNPYTEGGEVLVPVPKPTRETLAAMEKLLRSEGEAAKVAIRHARKRALDAVKELDSEDDRKQLERKVQAVVDESVREVDAVCAAKGKELSTAL